MLEILIGFIKNNISVISVIIDALICVCLLILSGEFRKMRKINQ